ncbi:hypothetical protein Plhal703r1_c17g0081491 [Plasmopara halstedii]
MKNVDVQMPRSCAHILNKVDELYSEDKDPLPFMCRRIVWVSGNHSFHLLWRAGDRILPACHYSWNCSQRLYHNFSSISNAFCEMVKKDNPTKKSEEEILNTSSKVYRNGLLWTYGFIRALLGYCSSYGHQNTSRMIRFDDRIVLQVKRRDLKDVCAVLDAQRLSSTIIHFLAPPNAEWPKWNLDQNSYGCNFGHLFRASNKEWCDVYVQNARFKNKKPIFICECK